MKKVFSLYLLLVTSFIYSQSFVDSIFDTAVDIAGKVAAPATGYSEDSDEFEKIKDYVSISLNPTSESDEMYDAATIIADSVTSKKNTQLNISTEAVKNKKSGSKDELRYIQEHGGEISWFYEKDWNVLIKSVKDINDQNYIKKFYTLKDYGNLGSGIGHQKVNILDFGINEDEYEKLYNILYRNYLNPKRNIKIFSDPNNNNITLSSRFFSDTKLPATIEWTSSSLRDLKLNSRSIPALRLNRGSKYYEIYPTLKIPLMEYYETADQLEGYKILTEEPDYERNYYWEGHDVYLDFGSIHGIGGYMAGAMTGVIYNNSTDPEMSIAQGVLNMAIGGAIGWVLGAIIAPVRFKRTHTVDDQDAIRRNKMLKDNWLEENREAIKFNNALLVSANEVVKELNSQIELNNEAIKESVTIIDKSNYQKWVLDL